MNKPTNKPSVGMTFIHCGQVCRIVKVYPFGTMDIKSPSGRRFRVTGLGWL